MYPITDRFWHDTCNAWKTINDVSYVNAPTCNLVYEPLFYNNLFKIDSKSYFMPDFFESCIYYPAHLSCIKKQGCFSLLTPLCAIFYKNTKGGKDRYNSIMIKDKIETPTGKQKWNIIFHLKDSDWKIIFKSPFKTTCTSDRNMTWFQTRINHSILGTNSRVSKITNTTNNRCSFCDSNIETIEYLLWECVCEKRHITFL